MPLPIPTRNASVRGVPRGNRQGQSQRFPSTVGGWDVYDSIAAMEPIYALTMVNMIPTTSNCVVRKGYTEWATGLGGTVETVFGYGGPSNQKLLGAANGGVFDATTAGAVGAALGSGYANNRWQFVNFGTPGGEYIFACNGADTPWNYNGTTIQTTPAITGITPGNIINVAAFKQRLFFVLKNSMTYAYLPINSIGGAALTIDLSSFFPLGGHLVAISGWGRANTTTPTELCVFLTSMGEYLVFQGDDPASVDSWALAGSGRIGAPVGYRCTTRIGSDLYIVCQDGLVAMSQIFGQDRVDTTKAISAKIGTAINNAAQQYGDHFGWQIFLYPRGNLAIVNVPITENQNIQQYSVYTATGAWCQFKNINASCWTLFNDNPYFGGAGGKIFRWDDGYSDNGSAIQWESRQAFITMGDPGLNKIWTMVRPIFQYAGTPAIQFTLEVDYQLLSPQSPVTIPGVAESAWDAALWDVAPWSDGQAIVSLWAGVSGIGRVCALHMKGTTLNQISWLATDFTFKQTTGLI
jgi:hypothetical protein